MNITDVRVRKVEKKADDIKITFSADTVSAKVGASVVVGSSFTAGVFVVVGPSVTVGIFVTLVVGFFCGRLIHM